LSIFETNPKPLKHLLSLIHNGDLALPDFQRDFVWDPGAIEELIESIMRNYPAGSLLFLKHAGEGFQVRQFEGAPELKSQMGTSFLVLDGQQRMTSLYQAFFGKGEHRFYIKIKELIESDDIESAVIHESVKRATRFGYDQLEVQAEKLYCPLSVVMGEGFDAWIDAVMDERKDGPEAKKDLRANLRQVNKDWIQPILDYQFPVITLGDHTPLDAVCKMFETLNRRGVKLTVFELLMARSFANKVSLRTLWDNALEEHAILEQFEIDPYYVLQVVSLLNGKDIKRREIMNLEPQIVSKHWDTAVKAMTDAVEFLQRNCGILNNGHLPYVTMLVPMAAAWANTSDLKGPQEATRRKRFEVWFWSSIFAGTYEVGPASKAVRDFKDLPEWLKGGDKEPLGVRTLYFNPDMFHEITPKQRALYRGTLALVTSNNALDFHKAEKLTFDYLVKNKVDDHHIFPQNYLKKKYDASKVNCVLNRTLIDKKTNIRISDKAPSTYLEEIESEVGEKNLKKILDSHLIPMNQLESDDFESFLKDRAKLFMNQLTEKIGKQIPTAPVAYIADENEEFEENEEKPDRREKYDAALINAYPTELLADVPKDVEEMFNSFTKELLAQKSDIWWKANTRRVVFWSPEKAFLTCKISKTGLHFVIFTDGKPINGVEPIVQKDRGGELWGRIKLKHIADLPKVMPALLESHARLQAAAKEGRATAWWAMTRKEKAA
jgi:hypothetical protein